MDYSIILTIFDKDQVEKEVGWDKLFLSEFSYNFY